MQFKMGLCCCENRYSPLGRKCVSKFGGLVGERVPWEGPSPSFPLEQSSGIGHTSQKYLENETCSVLDAKTDHAELWKTFPDQIQLKPGKSLPSVVDSKELFKLNKAKIDWDPLTSLNWPTMLWWMSREEEKYMRWSNLENGPLKHIFSQQKRFLLVLSQSKLTTPRTVMINEANCYKSHIADSRESQEMRKRNSP